MKLLIALFIFSISAHAEKAVNIGSKKFTESVILGEVVSQLLNSSEVRATHKAELGGTRILWNALESGDIDIYPEYTGTIEEEILRKKVRNFTELKMLLEKKGIGISKPLGFNNTYAIGIKTKKAQKLNLRKISDLKLYPDLKMGFGEEFKQRQDGWPGLKKLYGLIQSNIRGIDHDIAYRALENGDIDVTDLYSTDAEIDYYNLSILEDDKKYFPSYEAVFVYRLDQVKKTPQIMKVIESLEGKINDKKMISLNRQSKIEKQSAGQVASEFINKTFNLNLKYQSSSAYERIKKSTLEHLKLVTISLLLAILAAIPLGTLAAKNKHIGLLILWIVSIIQTVPALALLVILIKPLNMLGLSGIGDTPALIALFLYSLLPIVRSTHSGIQQIPKALQEAAAVIGLSKKTRLFKIELALAMPSILSGIKTAAVLNVGFATLGALVGAGGYGQSILTGIRLDDYRLILEGAVPSAVLALSVQLFFDFSEKFLVSAGIRK